MRVLNRRVSWLMAEKSFHVFFIGRAATIMGALPVARAQDDMKAGKGTVYLPDPENEPLLLRGRGTDFESALFMVGGSIHLPTVNGRAEKLDIKEIKGPEEIILRKAVSSKVGIKQLTGKGTPNGTPEVGFAGSKFKVTPHVDQTEVFNSVFGRLDTGGCIGIFPEGGSHDRAELLPLKGMPPQVRIPVVTDTLQ
jgi:glycerol-3-phosphate O-acyltransferase/dihydroxyacetone phosphate acyltransferase